MQSEPPIWRNIRNTSAFRLAVLLQTTAMAGVLVLLFLIYGLIAQELNQRSDHILHVEAARLARVPAARLPAEIERSIGESISGLNYFGLQSAGGRLLAGNLQLPRPASIHHTVEVDGAVGIASPMRVIVERTPSGDFILIGRDIGPLAYFRTRMKQILFVSAVLIVPLLLLASLALSIGPLRRVSRLQQVARTIAGGRFDARMPMTARRDELDLFAGTVNQMITAVERTLGQVKSVTDAVAHDLRTPLTHVRNQLYRVSREGGLGPGQAAQIDHAIDELDFVIERFAALLRISELEATKRTGGFAPLELSRLAASVAELYGPLAEERGIAIACALQGGPTIDGDEKLLFEALSNVLDNAIKFAPPNSTVRIATGMHESAAFVAISDSGPGIPQSLHKAVLHRFERGAANHGIAGSGLGLSIVSAIVQLHNFSLELTEAGPGLTVRIIATPPSHNRLPA